MKRKWIFVICLMASMFLGASTTFAAGAAQFKGWYKVISRTDVSIQSDQYLMVDVDTLANIWAKYADGPLPPDLEKYREESTVLAAFTDRKLYFLGFEKAFLVGNDYIAMDGNDGDRLELKRRPDQKYDMGVRDGGKVSLYLLNTPQEEPDAPKKH